MNNNSIKKWIFKNKVVLLFVLMCVGGFFAAGHSAEHVLSQLLERISRNSFIVLALIIPVLAGMGLNFGIVIGAMAAQIVLFFSTHWNLTGTAGFLATIALATPIAILFGLLVGMLFNRMKGSEMIGGLVLGYFAEGIYQLLFLYVFGGVIPIDNPRIMIATGIGVKNTIDLKDTIKYALDGIPPLTIIDIAFYAVLGALLISILVKLVQKKKIDWLRTGITGISAIAVYALTFIGGISDFITGADVARIKGYSLVGKMPMVSAITLVSLIVIVYQAVKIVYNKFIRKEEYSVKRPLIRMAIAAAAFALTYVNSVFQLLAQPNLALPIMTYLCIAGLCLFNSLLLKTRLGQNLRTVGQSRVVANAAGINVDRTRIIAMVLSTVLASWGQLIYLQNVGTLQTYGAHVQVGTFAIASLLVGGASVQQATNAQAITGVILFHLLFIIAPDAGKNLFGDAMIGEYFRVFVSYAVIAMALALHAWKKIAKKDNLKLNAPALPAKE